MTTTVGTFKVLAIIGAGFVFACALHANSAEYKMFYLNDAGRQIEATEAILATAKGDNAYKCQSVEFKVSKSGTSIGVKNVKRPKAN